MKTNKEIKDVLKKCIKYIDNAKEYGQTEENLIHKIMQILNDKTLTK